MHPVLVEVGNDSQTRVECGVECVKSCHCHYIVSIVMTAIAKFNAALSCAQLRLLPPACFLQKGEGRKSSSVFS